MPKEEGEDKWQPQETCRGGGEASAWDSQIIFDVVINKCFRKTENVSARKKTSSLYRSYKNCLSAYIDLSRQNNRFLINRAVCVILSVCFCEDFPAWIYFLCTNTLYLALFFENSFSLASPVKVRGGGSASKAFAN